MPLLSSNIRVWLHGLFAAAIGSFATAAGGAILMPDVFSFSHAGIINMLKLATLPALSSIFMYLKQSPLPAISPESGQK